MSRQRIYVMPFSHLDLFWLGEREECLSRGNHIISRAMAICDHEPSFRFLLEDMVFIKNYLATHPEKEAQLLRLVHAGQIEASPKYAGIYTNMIPGEAHVRNFIIGKELAHQLLNVDPQVAHQGDLPAHTPQYPQILSKANVAFAVLCRMGPSDLPLFHWQALDGSRVLTWFSAFSYGWGVRLKLHEGLEVARASGMDAQVQEVLGQTPASILMHWGMDLILPSENLPQVVAEWNRTSDVEMLLATPSEYYHAVRDVPELPVVEGEAQNCWGFRGSDPNPWDGRYLDGPAVAALTNGERFATISSLLGYIDFPHTELESAWMRLLEAMDHNSNGTGAQEGNRRHIEYRQQALYTGEEVLRRSLRPIAENVRVLPETASVPLVVFNGTSWERTGVVRAHVSVHGDLSAFQRDPARYRLVDPAGHGVPFQVLTDRVVVTRELELVFLAERVPPVGYKTYYLIPAQETPEWPATCLVSDGGPNKELRVETDELAFVLHQQTGAVDLFDKALDRWMVRGSALIGEETDLNRRTHVFEHYATGRSFGLLVDEVVVAENGPVRARVVVKGSLGTIQVQQEWVIARGLRTVALNLKINGPGEVPVALQQVFPTTIEGGAAYFGVPYGTNSFANVMPHLAPKAHSRDEANYESWVNLREIQDWVDVSDRTMGVTVATDRRMTVIDAATIKSVLAIVNVGPESHHYHFQIHPHAGDWRQARAYRWGAELAMPWAVLSVNDPFTDKMLPPEQSFCSVSAESVVLTVLKRSQDGRRLVWRGYEAEGRDASMALRFMAPLDNLAKTNLLEADVCSVAQEMIPVEPYEIVTVAAEPGE